VDLDGRSIKQYRLGTHRLRSPEETLQVVAPLFPTFGITRVADVTGLDHIGIPVWMCVRPNSQSLSVSQGKGLTRGQAKASAVMESVEAYYGQYNSLEVVHASYNDLSAKEPVADPALLNRPSPSLYADDLPIDWVRGVNLMDGTGVFVPYDLVHTKYLYEDRPRPRCFLSSTNGLASGNSLPEAVSHGICECIERDARVMAGLAMDQAGDPGRFFVDPSTIDSPLCMSLMDQLAAAGISLFLWDETSDIGIPVFGCSIFENQAEGISHNSVDGLFSGFGCHLSREIAMVRAVTEAVQSRLTYIAGSRDDLLRSEFKNQQSDAYKRRARKFLSNIEPARDFTKIPSLAQETIEEDINVQLKMLKQRGFSMVIAVELTGPSSEIGVVRVVIPGLAVDIHNGRYAARRTLHRGVGRKGPS